jgi:hypothetical protein
MVSGVRGMNYEIGTTVQPTFNSDKPMVRFLRKYQLNYNVTFCIDDTEHQTVDLQNSP